MNWLERHFCDLLLVDAGNVDTVGTYAEHLALMRGVEGGYGVVRTAKQGNLLVSDNRGHVLTEAPAGHPATFYGQVGDWCAGLVVTVLVFTFGATLPRPRCRYEVPLGRGSHRMKDGLS